MTTSSNNNWFAALQSKKVKKAMLWFWILLLVAGLCFYLFNMDKFTPAGLRTFLEEQKDSLIFIYILISIVRGVFLIPSTPFVLAGALALPDDLLLVFTISIIGILFSASLVYFSADYLNLDELVKSKSKRFEKIKEKINKHGFWVVLGWSFFPLVPTDLICYVAGITKMKYVKFILALFLGEAVLIGLYLWVIPF